jgi:DNA (cytosine-5)-methyltransferase 1
LHQKNHFYIQDIFNRQLFIGLEGGNELQMLDSSTHSYCEKCYEEHIKTLKKKDRLYNQNKPLQTLEIFSGLFSFILIIKINFQHAKGAGGLSIGLEESGFVKTKWAIEYAPSAAKTFQ